MSTRKTRQVRGNNIITDIQKQFDSDEEDKDSLTEEERIINKKLSESGCLEDGQNWNEKKALYKTLNASVTSANYEKNVRSPKPNERIIPIDLDEDAPLEKGEVASARRPDLNANKAKSVFARALDVIKKPFTNLNDKAENEENAQGKAKFSDDDENFNSSSISKCNKLNSNNKKYENILSVSSDDEEVFLPRKRPSPSETEKLNSVKKQKMDQTNVKLNDSDSKKLLKTEIELEKRQNSICFNRRSIQTILTELQRSHKLMKEASAKYKFPVRWGTPIVKNSNERWDSQYIPQKLADRYQRYLSRNGLEPPEQFHFEIPSENVFKNCRNFEEAKSSSVENTDTFDKLLMEDANQPEERTTPARENGKNKQTYGRKGKGRNARRIVDDDGDDEIENADDDDEWLPKKEPKKGGEKSKPLKNSNMKNFIEHRPPAAVKPDKKDPYKFFKSKNSDDVPNKIEGNEIGDGSNREGSQEIPNFGHQSTEEMDGGGDEEQVPCPICNKSFKKNLIENHATECASKTFQD